MTDASGPSLRRLGSVWLVLVLATGLSLAFGRGLLGDGRIVTTIVLAVALLKVRIIGSEFMELRASPLALRLAFDAWLLVVWSGLVGLAWLGGQ